MADRLSRERRSENMRRISSKGNKPETLVRRCSTGSDTATGCISAIFPGNPIWYFGSVAKRSSFMAAFGTCTKTAGRAVSQNPDGSIGSQSCAGMLNGTPINSHH